MKKTITLITLNLIINLLFAQNYINYYNLCNDADKEVYFKNYKKALDNYEKAFQSVDYVHADKYEKSSKCAIQIKDYKRGALYAKKAVLNGSSTHFWKNKKLKKFRKTDYYKILNDSVLIWEHQHLESINFDYKKIVDSLHYVDQRIIRNNKTIKGDYKIDKHKLPEDLFDLDSLIFQTLLEAIDKYGFPSEKNIGKDGYDNVWLLFHHNVRLPKNHHYLPLLENALKNGNYRPRDFAWMYDQGRLNIGKSPLFYYGVPLPKSLIESKKEEIDKSRKEYGLKPLSSTKIKSRGRRTVMKILW